MSFCCVGSDKKAYELGREIVRQNGIVVTGATTGMPYMAAKGAKDEGGMSIGISPASSYAAHVKTYHLPVDAFDLIIYSGFDYSGRNLILTKAADAVIVVCGGFGTCHINLLAGVKYIRTLASRTSVNGAEYAWFCPIAVYAFFQWRECLAQ